MAIIPNFPIENPQSARFESLNHVKRSFDWEKRVKMRSETETANVKNWSIISKQLPFNRNHLYVDARSQRTNKSIASNNGWKIGARKKKHTTETKSYLPTFRQQHRKCIQLNEWNVCARGGVRPNRPLGDVEHSHNQTAVNGLTIVMNSQKNARKSSKIHKNERTTMFASNDRQRAHTKSFRYFQPSLSLSFLLFYTMLVFKGLRFKIRHFIS